MNSTFIIVIELLNLPGNALFCEEFRVFVKCILRLSSWQNTARWSKLLLPVSSKIGSKRERLTTKGFLLYHFSIPFSVNILYISFASSPLNMFNTSSFSLSTTDKADIPSSNTSYSIKSSLFNIFLLYPYYSFCYNLFVSDFVLIKYFLKRMLVPTTIFAFPLFFSIFFHNIIW